MAERTAQTAPTFGIYRPLTPASMQRVQETLKRAVPELLQFMHDQGKTKEGFSVNDALGVTFVPLWQVDQDLQRRHVRPLYTIETIVAARRKHLPATLTPPLEVPLDELDWFCPHDRKLGAFLKEGKARRMLREQAGHVKGWLQSVVGTTHSRVQVRQPNHTSLVMYGRVRGPRPMNEKERQVVAEVAKSHLRANGIGSVVLDAMVFGKGYNKPIPELAL